MKRVVGFVLLVVVGTVAVDGLSDLTQSRPDTPNRDADTEVVVAVDENRFRGGVDEAAAALWAVCAGQTDSRPVDGGRLDEIDAGVYRVVLRPAVGEGERRKLVGCLEDFTVERVRGNVRTFREVDMAPAFPGV
jgi:hypothetical protein